MSIVVERWQLHLTICSNDNPNQSKTSSSNFYENALDEEIEDFKAKSKKVNVL
jgi:hypothetical protein